MSNIDVKLDKGELEDAIDMLEDMAKSVDGNYLKKTMRRKVKPIERKMKDRSYSSRLAQYAIGTTTAEKKTWSALLKTGVVKNKPSEFKDINSYGLAAILEYGTPERYRRAGLTKSVSLGKLSAKPFLRNSWDSEIKNVIRDTEKTIIKKIEKEAK